MAANALKDKAAKGMVWSAAHKYSMMFINFVSDIILARLLTPYDFGCIGMLAIFMVLSETFIDSGFGTALIQKKHPTQRDYSTIFFWNIGMAVIMYAILFFCAPLIAGFYEIPLLSSVLRVQGIILFIYAFNIIQQNQLRKRLNFRLLAVVNVSSSAIALLVTIFMAYRGFGVWSLVAKNLVASALSSIVFWFVVRWRPIIAFSWNSFKELFSFGLFMFLTRLLNNVSGQIQGLLIGKVYSPSTMGFYSKAKTTESVVSKSLSEVMSQVSYPLYAEVQDNRIMLQNMIQRLTVTLSYFSFPLMFLLLVLAKPIFVILYTEKWIASAPYFQALCVAGLAESLQSVNSQSIPAIGKSRVSFLWTVVKRGIGITSVVVGLFFWGMKGLIVGVVFNSWFSFMVNIGMVSKYIGYKWYKQLKDISPSLIVSLLAAVISYGVGAMANQDMYIDGVIKLFVFLFIYMGWSFLFKPDSYLFCKSSFSSFLSRYR